MQYANCNALPTKKIGNKFNNRIDFSDRIKQESLTNPALYYKQLKIEKSSIKNAKLNFAFNFKLSLILIFLRKKFLTLLLIAFNKIC